MTAVTVSLAASAMLCAVLAGLVRVDVPTEAPELVEDRVTEIADPDPHGIRWECEEARVRVVTYLEEEVEDDAEAIRDAKRWIDQGFRAMGCPTLWRSVEDPQLSRCGLAGCRGPLERPALY